MPTIAYLGPEHTNTHVAAQKKFGRRAKYVHAPTVDDVFQFVEREQVNFGVVPVENSLEGAVTHTLDRFIDFKQTPVNIVGEVEYRIQHYLITRPDMPPSKVEVVCSHPQALAQCRRWIETHFPHRVRLAETSSTAEAVKAVVEAVPGFVPTVAAIGRQEAAKEWGLKATPIPEERENKTRFLVLGLGKPPRHRHNKTALLFALKDRPGALYDALAPFKQARINLTKIESRPSKRKAWEYYFFIDLEGHDTEPRVKRALAALEGSTSLLRVLGSYPMTR
ncbi:MAG: prephenate dehydratase [Candidatus Omnitrophota bacterium]|nr:prephenate dehydratase [Candidatus Omnitrophota bacterium]